MQSLAVSAKTIPDAARGTVTPDAVTIQVSVVVDAARAGSASFDGMSKTVDCIVVGRPAVAGEQTVAIIDQNGTEIDRGRTNRDGRGWCSTASSASRSLSPSAASIPIPRTWPLRMASDWRRATGAGRRYICVARESRTVTCVLGFVRRLVRRAVRHPGHDRRGRFRAPADRRISHAERYLARSVAARGHDRPGFARDPNRDAAGGTSSLAGMIAIARSRTSPP